MVDLVVLDMAGTTVRDDGLVEEAFRHAIADPDLRGTRSVEDMLGHVRATMGESKIEVFRHLLGDEARARRATAGFEAAYASLVDAGRCEPIAGAADVIAGLRAAGVKTVLTTGFSRDTQDRILDALGWQGLADLTLCPADAGRGRPYPDLVLTAVLRLRVDDVRRVATVGDTRYDILCGLRAGARIVAGVLTGAHDRATLEEAGATHVLADVTALPEVLSSSVHPEWV